ncbi:hypothetical protein ACJX0J_008070, partial [Zea mays]
NRMLLCSLINNLSEQKKMIGGEIFSDVIGIHTCVIGQDIILRAYNIASRQNKLKLGMKRSSTYQLIALKIWSAAVVSETHAYTRTMGTETVGAIQVDME